MSDIVRLKNVGDTAFNKLYDHAPVVIAPGKERFVPWDVMVGFMGDPNARDTTYDKQRTIIASNLNYFYGCHGPNAHMAPELLPKLEAYDTDTGERISTVLDDPTGSAMPLETGGDDTGVNAHIEARLAAMEAKFAEDIARDALGDSGLVDVPEDKPTKPAVGPKG